jgi:hypothetical protein
MSPSNFSPSPPLHVWTNEAMDNKVFLQRWLQKFPQYKGRDLYVAGESYAGRRSIYNTASIVCFVVLIKTRNRNYFRHSARISLAEKPQPVFMSHANVQWGLDRHTNTPILQSPNPNRMLPLPAHRRPFLPHMLPALPPSLSHRLLPTCAAIHKFASFDLRRGPQQLCGPRHGGAPPSAAAPTDHHHLHYWPPRSGHCHRIL